MELRGRREALKGLLGLGLVSCTGRLGGRTIAGSIVGGAHARGHRLREAGRPLPTRAEESTVVIVGAGAAGLSAAWALERAGLTDFVVLELEDAAGGTARSSRGEVTAYPWGAHYVPVPAPSNRPLVALLEEVGAVTGRDASGALVFAEEALCADPQERLYFKGEWREGLYPRAGASAADLAQLEAFQKEMRRWSAWRDHSGRRAFDLPRARGSDAPEIRALDGGSMAAYLEARGWTSPRLRWLVDYSCRDDFGATAAQTSAWAGLHYFASRLEEGDEEPAELLTWPEGNGRLIDHLAGVASPRLRTGALVTGVLHRGDAVDVLALDAVSGQVARIRARHAILAVPGFVCDRILEPRAPTRAMEYGCWMVANLTLRDRPVSNGFPLAWDNVLYDSPSLGYVVATHQGGRDHGPTVFTYYRPFVDEDARAARARLLATTWAEWVESILADLAPAHPGLRDLVERVDVYLWGHAMVRPRPGLLWSEELASASRPAGRVRFAHTDLSGVALFEEAQYWGIRAAEDILAADRRAFRSWLD